MSTPEKLAGPAGPDDSDRYDESVRMAGLAVRVSLPMLLG